MRHCEHQAGKFACCVHGQDTRILHFYMIRRRHTSDSWTIKDDFALMTKGFGNEAQT